MTAYQGTEAILGPLNPAQREAVQTIHGPLMTLAGPGSGKTRVVTHRIAYLIDQGIPGNSILAMTFTNKAAQTIRERVQRMVGSQAITMGTFHGFGARFLRRYGRSVGLGDNFSILDTDDSKKVLEEATAEAKVMLTHLSIGDIAREISRLKTKLITPDILESQAATKLQKVVQTIYPLYQKKLVACQAVDFDDLLLYPALILRTEPDLRSELDQRYRYVLVDEYQDTNYAQYAIIRALSIDHPNLNVTGDPDQSIYSWRGANIENILNFERDFPTAKVVRLEENYRSTPEVLSLADTLIQNNRRRKAKNLIAIRESGPRVRLVHYANDESEAESICDQIKAAIVEQGARPGDFAVLYRTNAQSRLFERALLKRRLSYQLIGGFRFYQRQEIKDLLAYLRLIHNPRDDVAFDRVINTPPRGLGAKTLEKVAELARQHGTGRIEALGRAIDDGVLTRKAASSAADFLKLYAQLLEMSGSSLVEILRFLLEATGYVEYLARKKAADDDEAVDANINELLADAQKLDLQLEAGQGLEIFLEQVSLLSETDQLGEEMDRVTLMTLHAAKGLEFSQVYIVAVEQDILPHARCHHHPDQIEEERRLLFVGITRAQDRLQLSTSCRRGFNQRSSVPSQFLMEIPRLELEIVDQQREEEAEDFGAGDDGAGFEEADHSLAWRSSLEADGEVAASEDTNEIILDSEVALDRGEASSRPRLSRTGKTPAAGRWSKPPMAGGRSAKASKSPSPLELKGLLKSGSMVAPATTLAGDDVNLFQLGRHASHPQYGLGEIVRVDGYGTKRKVDVRFADGLTKTMVLAYAPLSIVP
jgi:DNA helicase-2/ATP-dependent DNA helicase PcrA